MDALRKHSHPNLAAITIGTLAILWFSLSLDPRQRLAATTLGLLYFLKVCILIQSRAHLPIGGTILYLSIWPGMDPSPLADRCAPMDVAGPRFVKGLSCFIAGMAALLSLVLLSPWLGDVIVGWLGVAALLLIIHFGVSGALTGLMWASGYGVRPLFESPFAARSLREFWTKRWNLPFVEMNRILFMPALIRLVGIRGAVFGAFLVSGVLHEVAISYPSGSGFGGPLLYFVIQGLLVQVEARTGIRSRSLTWLAVLGPLPLLFHEAFRSTFIVPLVRDLQSLISASSAQWYIGSGLWLLGVLQLCVLIASFQVPGRLKWPEELKRLSSFNRKLMWTQGMYIVLTIVAMAVATLLLHDELLRGERGALAIAGFGAGFWTLRLLVDALYYKHEDWPKGPQFVIGHTLLNCLFVLLACGYWGIVLWHA